MQTFLDKLRSFLRKKELSVQSRDSHDEESWTVGDIGAVFLRILKLLTNVVFVLGLLALLFGAGIGLGYAASLFHETKVPTKEELLTDVSKVSGISELRYADGSLIEQVDSDLLRIPVESSAISDNVKKAVIATEDEHFESHNGIVPKAVLRATLGSVVGLGSSSGGRP